MKNRLFAIIIAIAMVYSAPPARSADASSASSELSALVAKVRGQLQQGKRTETDLAPELKEFDDLIDRHKGEKSDDAAEIVFMKAMLYIQVLDKSDEGIKLVQQIKQDYPDTKVGKNADSILNHMKQQQEAKAIQSTLVEGSQFPDFAEKDLAGNSLSVANYKGKVVLVDFWATWCAPCVYELPKVQKMYEKYHEKGLEVIGISLDKSQDVLKNFVKDRNIPWPQFCDAKFWDNKLAQKYGIKTIPATFLLDGQGRILARDLRGDDLDAAIAKALPKNN
jgi:peroxiredoxin